MISDTIAAIATARGHGGIGIVKISGPGAMDAVQRIFRKGRSSRFTETPALPFSCDSHRLTYGQIFSPDDGAPIDDVLVSLMRGPNSYTGEDVVEINAHGGMAVVSKILALVLDGGARLAQPGEFTRRAFLNGKIDLTQAEAVAEMVQARTLAAARFAAQSLAGNLGEPVRRALEVLRELRVRLEASIDFPDESGMVLDPKEAEKEVRDEVIRPLLILQGRYRQGRRVRNGARIAVLGRPNVGKSSLVNRLLNWDRAIVTDVPGTTRDLVEEAFEMDGIPVVITDTAGIQDSQDPVETIGIRKAVDAGRDADVVLFMVDGAAGLREGDDEIYRRIQSRPVVMVVNKTDLMNKPYGFSVPGGWGDMKPVFVSAKTGGGIEGLEAAVAEKLQQADGSFGDSDGAAPNERQYYAIEKVLVAARRLIGGLGNYEGEELLAIDTAGAIDGLEEVLGIQAREDLLDAIFGRFCIGK